jgi:hypothetical protein
MRPFLLHLLHLLRLYSAPPFVRYSSELEGTHQRLVLARVRASERAWDASCGRYA